MALNNCRIYLFLCIIDSGRYQSYLMEQHFFLYSNSIAEPRGPTLAEIEGGDCGLTFTSSIIITKLYRLKSSLIFKGVFNKVFGYSSININFIGMNLSCLYFSIPMIVSRVSEGIYPYLT